MKNSENLSQKPDGRSEELNASFAASMFRPLGAVEIEAVLITMKAMISGATNAQALAAGDDVLIAHGRKPVMLMQLAHMR